MSKVADDFLAILDKQLRPLRQGSWPMPPPDICSKYFKNAGPSARHSNLRISNRAGRLHPTGRINPSWEHRMRCRFGCGPPWMLFPFHPGQTGRWPPPHAIQIPSPISGRLGILVDR